MKIKAVKLVRVKGDKLLSLYPGDAQCVEYREGGTTVRPEDHELYGPLACFESAIHAANFLEPYIDWSWYKQFDVEVDPIVTRDIRMYECKVVLSKDNHLWKTVGEKVYRTITPPGTLHADAITLLQKISWSTVFPLNEVKRVFPVTKDNHASHT